ncbi:phosphoglycerate mutase [Paractinoplanes deccanensis]|uniref:Phosphoglycerate mutase n=1 Tax=Paractinoplanes deccanensis TaxID=113561 RepID=A0ABQ3Y4S4_9ACTN|nr:histidine phosphatase family protein [Actinoplanes deccanensis]GID74984.1 phosphoglycerate mutase [Actinoplanes deccanensis]
MRTVYVVAHPEAAHHLENVVGGWHDSPLTPAGRRAATAIAGALREVVPAGSRAALFSSDLRRARETAAEAGRVLGAAPAFDRRLREKSYGVAEGRPQAWLDARFVPPPAVGDRMNHHEGVDGAETKAAFAERVYAAMDDILRQPGEHVVVVTHGFALTFVVAAWIKMPVESLGYVNLRAPSGSITTLREDDYFHNRQVVALGDTRHLTP